jgi:hypothetical protein
LLLYFPTPDPPVVPINESQLLDSLQENLHQIIAEAGANGISYKELRKKLNLVQPCISPAKRDAALDQLITAKRVQLKETANVYGAKCRRYFVTPSTEVDSQSGNG